VRPGWPLGYILLYVGLYGAFGVASPFWPKFFESRGLTPQHIGTILAAALVVRLAAGPLVGRLADFLSSLRLVLASCIVLAAAAAAAFALADTFWFVLLVALAQAAALAPTTSLADALAVNTARPRMAGKPLEYGWIRGAASAAFLSGTLIIGQLITGADVSLIIWMNVTLLIAAAAAIALVPSAPAVHQPRPDASTVVLDVRHLLAMAPFRAVIIVSALILGSHAMYDAFAVIRWSNAGLDASVISVLWAEAVAAEVVVFFLVGPWLLGRLDARGALVLAGLAGILRWSVMGFTNSILLLSVLQPLHGVTFALLHLACMRVMADVVPRRVAATAQAFYAFGAGLVTVALISLSGMLYARYGGAAFVSMTIPCLIALPFAWYGLASGSPKAELGRPERRSVDRV
jgi:MFS transporter, PPP family, 3-phenylpropionic acid transporter